MRICFLAPAHSYHTQKWCKWFCERGHEVHVISFSQTNITNAIVHFIGRDIAESSSERSKLEYLCHTKEVKRLISEIKPDFISAHRAPSYGMAAALSGAKNYALSVWGDDIFDFPKKSIFHRLLIQYSLHKAPHILSTSKAMAEEAQKYTTKKIGITPFGVDMELFSPLKRTEARCKNLGCENNARATFVIGTVKRLDYVYGIDTLLRAVQIVHKTRQDIPLQVRIAGTGVLEKEYHDLADQLGISDITVWLGFISQERAAVEWANMDLAVIPSRRESFGVSAVEAQACGTPVVISNIEGLKETTSIDNTCVCFCPGDERDLASKIVALYDDPARRLKMGDAARRFVSERFEINQCFERIEYLFNSFYRHTNQ